MLLIQNIKMHFARNTCLLLTFCLPLQRKKKYIVSKQGNINHLEQTQRRKEKWQ